MAATVSTVQPLEAQTGKTRARVESCTGLYQEHVRAASGQSKSDLLTVVEVKPVTTDPTGKPLDYNVVVSDSRGKTRTYFGAIDQGRYKDYPTFKACTGRWNIKDLLGVQFVTSDDKDRLTVLLADAEVDIASDFEYQKPKAEDLIAYSLRSLMSGADPDFHPKYKEDDIVEIARALYVNPREFLRLINAQLKQHSYFSDYSVKEIDREKALKAGIMLVRGPQRFYGIFNKAGELYKAFSFGPYSRPFSTP